MVNSDWFPVQYHFIQGGVGVSVDSTTFLQIFYNLQKNTKSTILHDFLKTIVDSTIIWHSNKDFLQSTVFLAKKPVNKSTGFVEENCRFYNQNWKKSTIYIYLAPPPYNITYFEKKTMYRRHYSQYLPSIIQNIDAQFTFGYLIKIF